MLVYTYKKAEAPFRTPATLSYHTASFAALTGRALTIFRAGLALNIIGSLVNLIACHSREAVYKGALNSRM